MKLLSYCFALSLLYSCGSNEPEKIELEDNNTSTKPLDGFWGNELYLDELLEKGGLEPQLLCETVWKCLVFEIKNDTLIRIGFNSDPDTVVLSKDRNNLAKLEGFGNYKLWYYKYGDRLQLTTLAYDKTSSCAELTPFKRMNADDGKKVWEILAKNGLVQSPL